MKFANIDADSFGFHNGSPTSEYLNFGDHIQVLAIDNLYRFMGIPREKIVRLSYYDLQSYSGEKLILPVNLLVNLAPLPSGVLFSPDIIPVFLGACFFNEIPQNAIAALKKWTPIGCRDEVTYRYLCEHKVESYLAGCLTAALPERETYSPSKVYLVDAPKDVFPFIPSAYKSNIVECSNVYYGKFDTSKNSPTQYAIHLYRQLAQEAKLVVTSRLHVASPCIAMGIPVIICLEQMVASFAWIEKYVPIYLKSDYANINWAPCGHLIGEKEKHLILETAANRIFDTYYKNIAQENCEKITCHYLSRTARKTKPLRANIGRFVQNFLQKNNHNGPIRYALWGVTSQANLVHDEIQKQCADAKLVAVYDTYKTGIFLNKKITSPEELKQGEDKTIYIVCAQGARNDAIKRFQKIGLANDCALILSDEIDYLCGRSV